MYLCNYLGTLTYCYVPIYKFNLPVQLDADTSKFYQQLKTNNKCTCKIKICMLIHDPQ